MALTKAQKSEVLNQLKDLIKDAKSVGFTTNTGLTVEEITNLRVSLREVNATFTLAKKTLIKIAFKEVFNVEINNDLLPNQIALVVSNEDAVSGLGKVNAFKKEVEDKIEWTGSYLDGELKDAEETKVIASMPSRDTLLGRMVGSLQSPLSGLARFLDALAQDKTEKEGATVKKEEEKVEEVKEETPKTKEA
jgi:large subunit ribosomal protein L10